MKKLIIIVITALLMGCNTSYGQNQLRLVNTKTDSIVKKDSVIALTEKVVVKDSVIHEQNRTITTKTEEVQTLKDTTVPVGNGRGIYIFFGIALLLGVIFFLTKKSLSKFITLKEIDLIKGVVITFIMAVLTGVYNIVNTGIFPTDWNTWRMIIITSFSTGIAYLLKNLLTPEKKEIKPEIKEEINKVSGNNTNY
jgi:hypothetical protein